MPLDLFLERADKTPMRVAGTAVFLSARSDVVPGALLHNLKHNKVLHERVVLCNVIVEDTPLVPADKRIEVEKLGKGFYSVNDPSRLLRDARTCRAPSPRRAPFGLVDRCRHHDLLRRPRNAGARRASGSSAAGAPGSICSSPPTRLSPARFYHLPPNRVVELGTQVTI